MSKRISKASPKEFFKLVTDRFTKPFWDACAEHRLVAACCSQCQTYRMPPSPFCHNCQSQEIDWKELSGEGIIYSFSIVDHAVIASVKECLPYVPAVIELPDAGRVRLLSNVVDADVDQIRIGDRVTVKWEEHSPGVSLPRFVLAPEAGRS
jgi:uncharacterized OB-fold protein